MSAHQQLNEQTPVPLKFASVIIGVVISAVIPAAVGWTLMSAKVETAQADIAAIRMDRSDAIKVWNQDRIDNAAFKSEVMTKLDRIERKLDRSN